MWPVTAAEQPSTTFFAAVGQCFFRGTVQRQIPVRPTNSLSNFLAGCGRSRRPHGQPSAAARLPSVAAGPGAGSQGGGRGHIVERLLHGHCQSGRRHGRVRRGHCGFPVAESRAGAVRCGRGERRRRSGAADCPLTTQKGSRQPRCKA